VPGLNGFNAEVRAAVDPSSAPGDTRIIVATRTPLVLVYDSATGRTRAGPALPLGVIGVVDVAFAKDGDLLFAASIPSQLHPGESDAAIVRCPGGTDCSLALTAFDSEFAIVVSPTVSTDAAVVAWNTDSLYISRDSGATFTSTAVPSGGAITAVALSQTFATDGTMTVGLWSTSRSAPWRGFTSDNGGAAFASRQDDGLRWIQVNAMLILPDGHELNAVATMSSPLFGIRCSLDGGRHWSLSC
jgi:hypothetical protein